MRKAKICKKGCKEEWMFGEGKVIKMYCGQVKRRESHIDKQREIRLKNRVMTAEANYIHNNVTLTGQQETTLLKLDMSLSDPFLPC